MEYNNFQIHKHAGSSHFAISLFHLTPFKIAKFTTTSLFKIIIDVFVTLNPNGYNYFLTFSVGLMFRCSYSPGLFKLSGFSSIHSYVGDCCYCCLILSYWCCVVIIIIVGVIDAIDFRIVILTLLFVWYWRCFVPSMVDSSIFVHLTFAIFVILPLPALSLHK